ncbi:MAG TPA: transaldolase [Acidimicrobiales bacterium]|nr:transaldolase [Acidimicrobiales bacterium]
MATLHDLYHRCGQSPWLDDLRRDWLSDGTLERRVAEGIRGITSNPSILQKAMAAGTAYDDQFAQLAKDDCSATRAYWAMAVTDVADALDLLRPLYHDSDGGDGFVSLELAPDLAHDTAGSIDAARRFHTDIARPNLLVKIPGTAGGVPAVRQMVAEGCSINVTLIFSLPRYAEVMEAYLSGLEQLVASDAGAASLHRVHSVASFFVSRVDTEVNRRLEAVGTAEALELRGRAAIAQAKLAYQLFRQTFSGPRWEALAARGARLQRPLWASTSTKDPELPDTLYVDSLIGPDTVTTMPVATLDAFIDHGSLGRTADEGLDEAEALWERLGEVGVDLNDVAQVLEDEGVAAFAKAFDQGISSLEDKVAELANR